MTILLKLSQLIDALNRFVGKAVIWLILASTMISAINAVVRKIFHTSSNAYLEVQWYLFAWAFLLAAGYTLLRQEHVKIDVLYGTLKRRPQVWIEIFGFIFFLIRWPAWLPIPIGVALLMLQGWSELIKRFAFLQGRIADPADKPDETPPEQELINALRANEHDTPAPGNQKA